MGAACSKKGWSDCFSNTNWPAFLMICSLLLMIAGMGVIGVFSEIMTSDTGTPTNQLGHWSYQLSDLEVGDFDPEAPVVKEGAEADPSHFQQWKTLEEYDGKINGAEAFDKAVKNMQLEGLETEGITAEGATETSANAAADKVASWKPDNAELTELPEAKSLTEENAARALENKRILGQDAVEQIKKAAEQQLTTKIALGSGCMAGGGLGALFVTRHLYNQDNGKGNWKPYAGVLAIMLLSVILFSASFIPLRQCGGMMMASFACVGVLGVTVIGLHIKTDAFKEEKRRLVAQDHRCRLVTSLKSVKHRRLVTLERLLDEINAAKEASLQREIRSQMK